MVMNSMKNENGCVYPGNSSDILTMAFLEIQPLDAVYSLSDAFNAGTLFPDLNKPLLIRGEKG